MNIKEIKRESEKDLDIQALRGIAVFLVFLNHANILVNGFLGVDIFFVISGFVIAKSVANRYFRYDLNFLGSFLYRRFARLLPALIVSTILICSIFQILDFLSEASIKTAFFSIFGLSNIYLARIGIDYFGIQTNDNPFVPTWSLGVEEQSYFFLALILILGFERNFNNKKINLKGFDLVKTNLFIIICILLSIFFYFFSIENLGFIKTYYLPFGRFWEIAVGWLTWKITSSNININFMKITNHIYFNRYIFTIILIILVTIPVKKSFFLTFLTVITTSLFLSTKKTNEENKIKVKKQKFNIKGLRFFLTNHLYKLGDRSYSFYLYHSAVIILFPKNIFMFLLAYVFTYFLSNMSYNLIENKFRVILLNSRKKERIFYILSIIFLPILIIKIIFDTTNIKNNIVYKYFTPAPASKMNFFLKNLNEESECSNRIPKITNYDKKISNNCIYLIGDSHAAASSIMFQNIAKDLSYKLIGIRLRGLYTESMMKSDKYNYNYAKRSSEVFEYLQRNIKSSDVVYVANQLTTWMSKTFNDAFADHRLYLPEKTGILLNQKDVLNFYLKDIEKLAILAYQKDATLIIYLTPPDFPVHPITCISPLKKISPLFDKYYFHKSCSYPSKIYFERIAKIESGLDLIQKKYKSNFKILKSYDIVCSQEICSPIRSGNSLYRDDDHPGNYFFKKLEPRVRELIKIKSLPKKL